MFSPNIRGRWTHFDFIFFQMGWWFNHPTRLEQVMTQGSTTRGPNMFTPKIPRRSWDGFFTQETSKTSSRKTDAWSHAGGMEMSFFPWFFDVPKNMPWRKKSHWKVGKNERTVIDLVLAMCNSPLECFFLPRWVKVLCISLKGKVLAAFLVSHSLLWWLQIPSQSIVSL